MPLGKPSAKTKANEKWQKKAGYTVKSFKLQKDTVEMFEKSCAAAGRTQASVITELMQGYSKGN